MKTNHTPGEWKVNDNVVYTEKNAWGSEPAICTVHDDNWDIGWRQMEANAKLIASAPDLLKACNFALQGIRKGQIDNVTEEVLSRAIAKALPK